MKKILIDVVALLGVIAVSCGVFINYGLGWALIIGGSLVICMALQAAKVLNNVSDL